MSENFDAIEADLLKKLEEVRAAKKQEAERIAKEKLELELSQPSTITFLRIAGNFVHVQNDPYRSDIYEIFKTTDGRIWKGIERVNAIPLGSYESLIKRLKELKNIEIKYNDGIEATINDILYAPDFKCELGERHFKIKASRKAFTYELTRLPGHIFDYVHNYHTIPLTEGWRLFEFAQRQENFVWTEEAKEFVLKQVENRLRLDELAKSEDVELEIEGLNAKLKNFQKIGIKFFELNGGRGILADEMGTGKTLQMIGLIVHKKYKALVVCPAPLKENWLREIRKFAPQLTTYTCQGSVPDKFDVANLITKNPDVIIINYDIIARSIEEKSNTKSGVTERFPWVEVLNLTRRDIMVLDEGHYIKNTDSGRSKGVRKIQTPNAISLTGTPILNRPGELWAMLHVADPITFPAFETFKNQYTYDGKTVRNVEELKSILKPLMIRRLKRDVIKELEPINRTNSYYELSEKGRKLYDRVLAGVFEVLSAWNPNNAGEQKQVTNMLVQIQRLKQVVAYDGIEGTADLATEIYDSSPEEGEPNKVLIFSQFKATTYAISRRLGHEALSFVGLTSGREFVTAQSHEQQRLIDQFQTDPNIHYLCVTEKTAKEGHNITAAKAVIFNDLFWTPAGHQQAEARAYGRLSDLHTIDAYYRIGVNSISEKIMDLLQAKMQLIEQVIEGVEASRADTSIIHELLKSMKEEMWSFKKGK